MRRLPWRGLLIFSLISCSSIRDAILLPSDKEIEKNLDSLTETEVKKVNWGPSVSEGENLFRDKTTEYGLEGVEAVNFLLIDLNRDFIEDLIVIPNFFSSPIVYLFDPVALLILSLLYLICRPCPRWRK